MARLTITRGLPGSGKTTWAREQQAVDPHLFRVNRDDLRAMLRPDWKHGDLEHEDMLSTFHHAMVWQLLDDGYPVVVDDTNLSDEHLTFLLAAAVPARAHVVTQDFRDVPLDVCIERDSGRPNPVGEQVIRRMHAKYLAGEAAQA